MQFNKSLCRCLRKAAVQVQTQEQTQEVRLTDAMPDIGRVLGSWGQILIRGKEWHGDSMAVSGGVMVWMLYAPEDGTDPRVMDAWVPFQMKWDVPQSEREGAVCIYPELKGIDVRSTSARKLMVRTVVSILGEALEPTDTEIFTPGQIPEDVQLLHRAYPMELPQEAGEKAFRLDEQLRLDGNVPGIRKIIRCYMKPKVDEHRVMGSRLVFRGVGKLGILYMGDDESIHDYTWDVPFSQYTDLNNDFSSNATACLMPIVTGLETEPDEDRGIYLKCGISCQYVIYDRVMVEVVEDAYSPHRNVQPQIQMLKLPMLLERRQEPVSIKRDSQLMGSKVLDAVWYKGHPRQIQNGDILDMELGGQFQMLYMDEEGTLQGAAVRSEDSWQIPAGSNCRVDCYLYETEDPEAEFTADGVRLSASAGMDMLTFGEQGIPMVTGLEFGELTQPDPGRPSLILRRAGENELWDVAKATGSTVDAISKANGLEGEPDPGRLLLIPVS